MDPSMYREFAELHEARHWWFVGRRRIVGALLVSLANGRRNLRILDIGCGTGGMIPVLAAYGRVTGIDGSPEALRYSREKHAGRADLLEIDFPAQVPPGEPYDLVTLFDVLEHLDDDSAALRRAAGLLAEGGRLVVTVPAHRFLWSPHDEINQHRRRYSRRELEDRIRETGLRLRRLSYFNTFLFPAVVGARLVRRRLTRKGDRRSDFRIRREWLNRLLADFFGAEAHLLRKFNLPFGVSLLAVAEKVVPGDSR